jgi:hypothetical protein
MNSVHAAFWAKAHPVDDAAAAFHPLVAHCLDVAAVALLLPSRAASRPRDARVLGFLVALHDIGKISRPFQAKERDHWPVAALGAFPTVPPPAGPAHDAFGLHLLRGTGVTEGYCLARRRASTDGPMAMPGSSGGLTGVHPRTMPSSTIRTVFCTAQSDGTEAASSKPSGGRFQEVLAEVVTQQGRTIDQLTLALDRLGLQRQTIEVEAGGKPLQHLGKLVRQNRCCSVLHLPPEPAAA